MGLFRDYNHPFSYSRRNWASAWPSGLGPPYPKALHSGVVLVVTLLTLLKIASGPGPSQGHVCQGSATWVYPEGLMQIFFLLSKRVTRANNFSFHWFSTRLLKTPISFNCLLFCSHHSATCAQGALQELFSFFTLTLPKRGILLLYECEEMAGKDERIKKKSAGPRRSNFKLQ